MVKIASDGAIKVGPGDSISKYCGAIYKLPPSKTQNHWNEFGRKVNGRIVPLENVNLIRVGETIYHLPSATNQISFDEVQIVGTAWPQMQFRLRGGYAKTGVRIPAFSVLQFVGKLEVKFSHEEGIYFWDTSLFFPLADPVPLPNVDAGLMATEWSQSIEFDYHRFDPVKVWPEKRLWLECVLARIWNSGKIKMFLRWALPAQSLVRMPGGSPIRSFHIDVGNVAINTLNANPFPNFDAGPSASFELKGFKLLDN